MTAVPQPPVIPAVALADRPGTPRWRPPARPAVRRPLPLAKLSQMRHGSAVYGLSTVDASGRVSDRAIRQALRWAGGLRLDIREVQGLVVITPDTSGVFRVSGQGFVHLPAAVRHWCRLSPGDRVLLAAYPDGDLLVVHTPPALDELVEQIHAAALGGDRA